MAKGNSIKTLLGTLAGKDWDATRKKNGCMTCEVVPIPPWRDGVSATEYEISLMCQTCQDKIFGGE